jgi:hypothetical protein
MKKEQKPLKKLSNEVLFRMIVNRLWIEYDGGGISDRRGYQSTLIEGFMHLFPLNEPHYGIEGDIHKEIKDRTERYLRSKNIIRHKEKHVQLELPFQELGVLSNIEFALLSLEEMCRWYKEESERLGFYYQFPGKVANHLKNMCELCYKKSIRRRVNLKQITKDLIIREGDRRNEYKNRNESRVDDFQIHGINPWRDQMYIKT